jgi:hypothetical protein
MEYVGIDVHKKQSQICLVSGTWKSREFSRYPEST